MHLFEELFNRSLSSLGLPVDFRNDEKIFETDRGRPSHQNDQIPVTYKINSYGYRGEEFNSNSEVLVLGCSQTFGAGMPQEYIWPEIFCKSLQKKYSNLASLGDSLQGQVYKAFKYFQEFGNPKIIIACFPILRMETPNIPGKLSRLEKNRDVDIYGIEMAYINGDVFSNISKAPHDPECVIPPEMAVFYNFMFLEILRQYCRSNNIIFIWSNWDDIQAISFAKYNVSPAFLNYVNEDIHEYGMDQNLNELVFKKRRMLCHSEFKNNKLFDYAADHIEGKRQGHWGIHMHLHVAEAFINTYRSLTNA